MRWPPKQPNAAASPFCVSMRHTFCPTMPWKPCGYSPITGSTPKSPFSTILLGQPTLAAKMALGILAALEQRITVRRAMTGMTSDETAGYVRHHLQLAGRSDPLFTDDALALIHESGRGKPRGVNRLAIAALIAACAAGKNLVDEASARSAIAETNHDPQPTTP